MMTHALALDLALVSDPCPDQPLDSPGVVRTEERGVDRLLTLPVWPWEGAAVLDRMSS